MKYLHILSLHVLSLHSLFASLLFSMIPLFVSSKKVKVYILAGQSNMVGMGSLKHLDSLTQHPGEYRKALVNKDGEYKTSENVIVKNGKQVGKLTVGNFAPKGNFGPELMFGFTLDAQTTEPIFIIKTAWGGKSLAVDFRPPSSGIGHYESVPPAAYGQFYRAMIEDLLNTLSNIGEYVPGATGYDLKGFVWFQGWNDLVHAPMVAEYAENLGNLIRDVRSDLNDPDLPFGTAFLATLNRYPLTIHHSSNWRSRPTWNRPARKRSQTSDCHAKGAKRCYTVA